jgi:hypothetical protein
MLLLLKYCHEIDMNATVPESQSCLRPGPGRGLGGDLNKERELEPNSRNYPETVSKILKVISCIVTVFFPNFMRKVSQMGWQRAMRAATGKSGRL